MTMIDSEAAVLEGKLKDLELQLEARIREWKARGEFSNVHDALVRRQRAAQMDMARKLHAAVADHRVWKTVRLALEKDINSLAHELMAPEPDEMEAEDVNRPNGDRGGSL
jgi:hypothetical protein